MDRTRGATLHYGQRRRVVIPCRQAFAWGSAATHAASSAIVDAAVTIVSSPVWLHAPRSPHQQLDGFFPTALLLQNASHDETVPPQASRELHQALRPRHASAAERLCDVEHPGEQHLFSEPAWRRAWTETLGWLDRFAGGGSPPDALDERATAAGPGASAPAR
jgi:hypothetical protein